jgi:hypothetical protein
MSVPFHAPGSIVSGRHYRIVQVDGRDPVDVADFVGDAEFVLDLDGARYDVHGAGASSAAGVRFHEKDSMGHGRDVRVWAIQADPHGGFVADHVTSAQPPCTIS